MKMQGAIARVCMVVAAAILNHPLLFPQENTTITLPDQDEELMARMQEHEERLEMERARLEKELSQLEPDQKEIVLEEGYTWYLWSAVSLIIFFIVKIYHENFTDIELKSVDDDDIFSESGSLTPNTMILDKDILSNFCNKCTYNTAHENWKVREFVEGFADDLLEMLRSECDREAEMEVGDFIGIGSMFESWKVCKPLMCDLLVPFSPPDPFCFQFNLWCGPLNDMPPDMQGCGIIKVTKFGNNEGGCLCGSTNLGDDVLCLLHSRNDAHIVNLDPEQLLCSKNTPYLAKDQVMKWFQISVTKAWGRISHKYNFEVTFRNLDTAGALKIRFRSGKVIVMNIIPVIQLKDTDAYFVSYFPSDCGSFPDPYWSLSFSVYERHLLKYMTNRLPKNACHLRCLQVVTFLHTKQTGLTGKNALSNYHWKTVVLHLLLNKRPSMWSIDCLEHRLRDVFTFMHRSLQEKRLCHILIGNKKVAEEIQVPGFLRRAESINLFRCMVLQRNLYAATMRHFHEMMRNFNVLLQEYTPHLLNRDTQQ